MCHLVTRPHSLNHSMRREAYKLAAKCGAGYACVWMDAPFALALKRCASRSAEGGLHVDEAVVRRMDQRLEPPDSGSHTWEGNSMRVEVRGAGEEENSDVVEAGTRAAVLACIEAGWREPGACDANRSLDYCGRRWFRPGDRSLTFFYTLTATIPQPDSFSPEELEAVRRQTRESALQATELALRKVSERAWTNDVCLRFQKPCITLIMHTQHDRWLAGS